jgi:hypothetical protein
MIVSTHLDALPPQAPSMSQNRRQLGDERANVILIIVSLCSIGSSP